MSITNEQFLIAVKKRAEDRPIRSEDADGGCRYRNSRSNACFIGDFISDEECTEEMENLSASAIQSDYHILPLVDSELMDRVQNIHDHTPIHEWVEYLNAIDLEDYKC